MTSWLWRSNLDSHFLIAIERGIACCPMTGARLLFGRESRQGVVPSLAPSARRCRFVNSARSAVRSIEFTITPPYLRPDPVLPSRDGRSPTLGRSGCHARRFHLLRTNHWRPDSEATETNALRSEIWVPVDARSSDDVGAWRPDLLGSVDCPICVRGEIRDPPRTNAHIHVGCPRFVNGDRAVWPRDAYRSSVGRHRHDHRPARRLPAPSASAPSTTRHRNNARTIRQRPRLAIAAHNVSLQTVQNARPQRRSTHRASDLYPWFVHGHGSPMGQRWLLRRQLSSRSQYASPHTLRAIGRGSTPRPVESAATCESS